MKKPHGWIATLLALAVIGTGGSEALAHGGYYQGPRTPDGVPLPVGGPTTPGGLPGGPTTGGPGTTPGHIGGPAVTGRDKPTPVLTTNTRGLPSGLAEPALAGTAWEHWWALNKTRYLRLAAERTAPTRREERTARERKQEKPTVTVDPTLKDIFVDALNDPNPDLRASGAVALARGRFEGTAQRLAKVAGKDESTDVRVTAVIGLSMLGGPESFPTLFGILGNRDQPIRVRAQAAVGVGMTGGEDAAALLSAYLDLDLKSKRTNPPVLAASAYYGLGLSGDPNALPLIVRALKEPGGKPIVRSFAALAAARLEARETLPLLFKAMNRPDVSLRRSAALAAGWILGPGDTKSLERLQLVASINTDPGTRRMATLELGRTRCDSVRVWLESRFLQARPVDKPYVAVAMALQGDPSVTAALREALKKDDFEESLQGAYAIALGILGDREAIPQLEREVRKPNRTWSPGYAALGLAMIGSRGSVETIRKRLDTSTSETLKTNLTVALCLLRDDKTRTGLVASLTADDSVFRRTSAAMSAGMLRMLEAQASLRSVATGANSEPSVLRAAAVSALGRIAATGDTPLLDALDGNNFSVELGPLVEMATVLNAR